MSLLRGHRDVAVSSSIVIPVSPGSCPATLSRIVQLVLLMLASVPAAIAAQVRDSSLVSGRVTDRGGQPIAGARVTTLDETQRSTLTMGDGRYQLRLHHGDATGLRVSAIGYEPAERSIDLDQPVITANFSLVRAVHLVPEITVTSQTPEELATIPGATAVIGEAVLHGRAPISLMEAIRTVPGFTTSDEDPYGLNLNIGLRGLPARRSSRVLLLEDGMPILLGPYGDPTMHYAPPRESIERLEVIQGSGQIMNGPQTVGGVVNFVTRSPRTNGFNGALTVSGGDLSYKSAQLVAGTGGNGSGVLVDYLYREGDGVRLEQGHTVHNAMVKGLVPLGASQLLLKTAVWDENSRISETGLTQDEFEADPFSLPFTADGRFNVRRYMGQAIHQVRLGSAQLRTNAYFSSTNRASWRQSGESEERIEEDEYAEDFNCPAGATSYTQCGNQGRPRTYRVFGLEPRLSLDYSLGALPSTLDLGLRFYHEDVRRRQYLGNTPTSREDDAALTLDNGIESLVFAGFVQNRFRVSDFTFSPAVRLERVTQDNENNFPGSEALLEDSYTEVLPGIGLTYHKVAGATFFAGVHRGFAPPRPADVYDPQPGQPIVLVDPETSWNWEAGVRLTPRVGVGIDATLFRMDFGNEIIEAPAGEGQRFINAGRTTHQGLEVAGRVSLGTLRNTLDDLTLTAAYTFVPTARFDADDARGAEVAGNRLPYAPRHLFSASATFAHRSGFSIGSSLEHTAEQFGDEENTVEPSDDGQDGILPSYSVVSAFGAYAIPNTRATLRLSVRNLFDRLYITQRNEGIYTGVRRFVRGEIHWAF